MSEHNLEIRVEKRQAVMPMCSQTRQEILIVVVGLIVGAIQMVDAMQIDGRVSLCDCADAGVVGQ